MTKVKVKQINAKFKFRWRERDILTWQFWRQSWRATPVATTAGTAAAVSKNWWHWRNGSRGRQRVSEGSRAALWLEGHRFCLWPACSTLTMTWRRLMLLACALIAMQRSDAVAGDNTKMSQASIDAAMAAAAASADGLDANGNYDSRMASIRRLDDDKLRRLLEKHGVAAPADADSKTLSRLVYHFRGITLETLQGKKQKRQANGERSVEVAPFFIQACAPAQHSDCACQRHRFDYSLSKHF
eukprot:6206921-Pleurochrysis_carterae.AAC.4